MEMERNFFPGVAFSPRKNSLGIVAALLAMIGVGLASESQAANVLYNGDFEDGTYTSTIGGYSNNRVPNGWTPNIRFVQVQSNNLVQYHGSSAGYPQSGTYFLYFGTESGDPSVLSQTFSDVAGANYSVSFWAFDGTTGPGWYDPIDFLTVTAGGVTGVTLYGSATTRPTTYSNYVFNFIGSGSDTLTMTGQSGYCCWQIDNIAVNGPAVSPIPEPSTWAMMLLGFAGLGFAGYRRNKSAAPAA
jgi:hypothetical protein